MKTIKIDLYTFDELSDEAKKKAIESYRDKHPNDNWWYWNEAENSVKEFHLIFPTRSGRNSWLDVCVEMDHDEMTGHRLQKWIWNNFGDRLFKGRYYSVKCDREIRHKRVVSKKLRNGNVFNAYYSAIQKQGMNCVLTGLCYDDDLLKPIYDFLEARHGDIVCGWKFESIDAYALFAECFLSLKSSLESEDEYRESDEGVIDDIESNDAWFELDGTYYSE